VYENRQFVPEFLQKMTQKGYAKKSAEKMKRARQTPASRLRLECQFVLCLTLGKPLATATKFLEGDGFLAPYTWETVEVIDAAMKFLRAHRRDSKHSLWDTLNG